MRITKNGETLDKNIFFLTAIIFITIDKIKGWFLTLFRVEKTILESSFIQIFNKV